MRPEHAAQVLAIYQLGIDEGNATFETTAPTWEAFDNAKLPDHRLVALDEGDQVLGWAADSRVVRGASERLPPWS
jgi:phosphinothricin acetyltransferase